MPESLIQLTGSYSNSALRAQSSTHTYTHRNTHFCIYISGFKLLFSALDPQISILQGAISEEHKGQSHSVRSSRETWTNTQSHTKSSEM